MSKNMMTDVQSVEIELLRASNRLFSDLLAKICLTLKGQQPEMGLHSWHDLPELVERQSQRIAYLEKLLLRCVNKMLDSSQEPTP